jgi:hypothetical protein
MRDHLMDLLKTNFEKLGLSVLFLTCLAFVIHALHHGADAGVLIWIENLAGQILAALLTLMTGRRMMARTGDPGGNGNGDANGNGNKSEGNGHGV